MLRNFTWVIPRKLAGMALPTGAYRACSGGSEDEDLKRDLVGLKQLGVRAVVTLTHDPLHGETLERCGLCSLHLPVDDMTAPAPEQIRRAVLFIDEQIERGGVVVHCAAGIGRTGTVLAGYLVWRGSTPESAVDEIRARRPGSIETPGQESSVYRFAESMAGHDA